LGSKPIASRAVNLELSKGFHNDVQGVKAIKIEGLFNCKCTGPGKERQPFWKASQALLSGVCGWVCIPAARAAACSTWKHMSWITSPSI